MSLLLEIVRQTLDMVVLAAPYFLFGLLVAGLLHVLMPERFILRWMGRKGLSGVTMAALVGVPLPVCSCGVVPIAVELRRKGASRPASLSFLTTTPESSVDSILLTWGLMGPVMAIARPIAAFFTALIGGVLAIAYPGVRLRPEGEATDDDWEGSGGAHDHGRDHNHDHDEGDDCEDDCHSHGVTGDTERGRAALAAAWDRVAFWRRRRATADATNGEGGDAADAEAADTDDGPPPSLWRDLIRPALRYGFVELLDDLAFWLVLGLAIAGVLAALLPADLGSLGLGGGLLPMLFVLIVGIPLYMCASASTPVAAALMAKGISPGAALVFLLAGPATNAATLFLLAGNFGRRFVRIYLIAVVIGALGSGIALDLLLAGRPGAVRVPFAELAAQGYGPFDWFFFALLAVLLIWRMGSGAARSGWRELATSFAPLSAWLGSTFGGRRAAAGGALHPPLGRPLLGRPAGRWLLAAALLALIGYLALGLVAVPPGSEGYGFVFGRLAAAGAEPGLHWLPPAPVGRWEVRRSDYARKADIGFRTDLELLDRRRELTLYADPNDWHSAVAAMNADPATATYLTGDENLVEMSLTVHYRLSDPAAFFYGIDHGSGVGLVVLYAEAAARELLAGRLMERLLTEERQAIEVELARTLGDRLAALSAGVEVVSVHVVDIHPPGGAVFAFRDVSSAREDKETRIHRAREVLAREVPRARGEAARLTAVARAAAAAAVTLADGRGQAFRQTAEAAAPHRRLLREVLWFETAEAALAGRQKYIVPSGAAPGGRAVRLWRRLPVDEP